MRDRIKPMLFAAALIPFALLLFRAFTDGLGANPIKEITHFTGDWTLNFLFITLAVTPFRRLTGVNAVARYRRMFGLFAFFYACLHFLTYFVLDQFFDWGEIWRDIAKRPYITVGFSAFVLLIPLAATSTNRMVQRIGPAHWRRLHRAVYAVGTLGVLHYLWLVKADIRPPVIYGVILIALLILRLPSPPFARVLRKPLPGGQGV
ncbi:MAG: sulfoxide reductase heme-binding subunit YedZ [Gammaproteobacteria bacterium]|nr:sulfoxide reductase heme-binding subunit YedZ [Gammaproteobacteria bacterium]